MLEMKIMGSADPYLEYQLLKAIPEVENGFCNEYHDINFNQFQTEVLKELNDRNLGLNLKPGYVPDSKYILWLDGKAIGLYNFRHYLNDFLRNGPGHIGYTILKEYRRLGYGSQGLAMLIALVKDTIPEDAIYMSCNKDNKASLKIQLKNGAYIANEDEKHYYTRIKVR